MNTRERFVRTLTGKTVDRVPFMKVFGGANAALPEWEREYPGIRECIDELLGFEGMGRGWGRPPVHMDPSHYQEGEVIRETGHIAVVRRGDGTVEQRYKAEGADYNRHTVEWPVKNTQDW